MRSCRALAGVFPEGAKTALKCPEERASVAAVLLLCENGRRGVR